MNRSFGITDPGLKRKDNQDTFFTSDEHGLWILADGMGGNRGGEVASQIAKESLSKELIEDVDIKTAILTAHRAILSHGSENFELKGLGTTVVLVKEFVRKIRIVWVGDSRVYLWRNQTLTQLSKDHSVVERLLDSGMINKSEAINHPQRNLVTSVLGLSLSDDADLEIGQLEEEWREGDKLMLCSDGLSDELEDTQIKEIMTSQTDSESQVDALLKAALAAGGRDNTTVVIIDAPKIKSLIERLLDWIKN